MNPLTLVEAVAVRALKHRRCSFWNPGDRIVVLLLIIRTKPSSWVVLAGRRSLSGSISPEVRAKGSEGGALCWEHGV